MSAPAVSVVIPALNEADNLRTLLPRLREQEGVRDLELIVVDSGSTDGTPELARSFGSRVLEILPEEFSHSGARNLGGMLASHELLLFTTGDALPPSSTWLAEIDSKRRSLDVAAISCREIPRPDSDLFTRAQLWYHYDRFLELAAGDRVLRLPAGADPTTLRKCAQLSNVACLLPARVHRDYPFRQEYAEDLDLGVRLVRDGRQLGLVRSPQIVHSHLRPAYYHLKRGFVDKLVLSRILGEPPPTRRVDEREVEDQVLEALRAVDSFSLVDRLGVGPVEVEEVRGLLREWLSDSSASDSREWVVAKRSYDQQFATFLGSIAKRRGVGTATDSVEPHIRRGVLRFLEVVLDYLAQSGAPVDGAALGGLDDAKYKQLAALSGAYLAEAYRSHGGRPSPGLEAYHQELADGKLLWLGRAATA